jgi:signal transduction histidine kinase
MTGIIFDVPEQLAVLDALPMGVTIVDEDHIVHYSNPAFAEKLCGGIVEVTGGYCPHLVHDNPAAPPACPLPEAVATNATAVTEFYDPHHDQWLHSLVAPLDMTTPDGKRLFIHTITDVSARRSAEDHRSLASAVLEILLTGREGEMYSGLLEVVLEALGSPFGFVGTMEGDAFIAHSLTGAIWERCAVPEKSVEFPAHVWRPLVFGPVFGEGHTVSREGGFNVPKGHLPITRLLAAPIALGGEVLGAVAVANAEEPYTPRDVSALEQFARELAPWLKARMDLDRHLAVLEATVKERTAELTRANEAKSAFLASTSHEIRTPLNSIIGFSTILAQGMAGPLNEEQARQLGMVRSAGELLLGIVNNLLDLAKIEAGRIEANSAECAWTEPVGRAVERLQTEAADRNLTLELVTEGDPAATAHTDARILEQIVTNLLGNALKFTEHGGVTVTARLTDVAIEVAVTDTGVGIPADEVEHIFDEYYQVESPSIGKPVGTGLGLPLCRSYATLLGGTVVCESEVGVGSTFTLTVPRVLPTRAQ